jgi:hypothetical protein
MQLTALRFRKDKHDLFDFPKSIMIGQKDDMKI